MSNILLWGTSITPSGSSLGDRVTSAGDVRVDDSGDIRVVSVPGLQVIFFRDDDTGDLRITSEGDFRITEEGLLGPQYYESASVTSDGDQPFTFQHTTNPWQPTAQGGENTFQWAYLALSWSMAATIQVTPVVDGDTAALTLPDGSQLKVLTSVFSLPQQPGSLQRVSQVVAVPLARAQIRNGVEVGRWYMRGERLQLTVQSTGPLGVGELTLDGIEVEFEAVRKATYPGMVVTTN